MVVRGVVKLGTATAAAAAGVTVAAVASDPHGVTAQLVRLKLEQALGAAQQSSVRTAGQLQQALPQSTVVHVNAGGGASWRTLALVGGASAALLTWMRCKRYTWEDIAYVTQHAFRESVATINEGLEATAGAIEATREQLRAKIGEVEQQLDEATDGLHRHVEEQVGAARADIADVREVLKATDEALQQVYDDMATESQVEELRVMLGAGQRTAERTNHAVDRMRGDLGHVATDIAALRQLVAAQYAEQQRWVARARRGKAEHRRCVDDYRDAMRHHGFVRLPTCGHIVAHQPGHGIRHGMRHMASRISKSDARQHAGKHQWLAGRELIRLFHRPDEIGADQPDRFGTRHIAIRIGALAERARRLMIRPGPLGIGPRRQ